MHKSVVVLPLLALLAGCGGSSSPAAAKGPADLACNDTLLPAAEATASLPAGIPAIDGATLYAPSTQGKTFIVFAHLPTKDFVKVRDDYVTQLKAAGWTIDGTDQESVEAEAQFSKQNPLRTGTVKLAPVCKGHISVRFKVNL